MNEAAALPSPAESSRISWCNGVELVGRGVAAHASLSVFTSFRCSGGLELGRVALVRNPWLLGSEGPRLRSRAARQGRAKRAAKRRPLTGTAARSYVVAPGPIGRGHSSEGVRGA